MKRTVAILAMLLVSVSAPMTAFAATTEQEAYTGSHVTFETRSTAVVDYAVDDQQTFESVRVQSQSNADSALGLGGSTDLAAVTEIAGAALSLESSTDANASLRTESGATIDAHDNGHGTLVVAASDQSQYVAMNVSQSTAAEQVSEERVVFTTEDGTKSTAMVVGEGDVTVTESGNLTAALEEDSRLAVRAYTEARSEADESQERMIVNETAAASVYLMEQGGETVTDTVTYGQDTSVEVKERAEGRVEMTASRTEHEGRVIITHVSNETFESVEDLQVSVDGAAAASADSAAELRQAVDGGDTSKYVVQQSSSASASAEADVLVGINHFSSRAVTMTDSSEDGGDSDSSDSGSNESDSSDGNADDTDSNARDSNDESVDDESGTDEPDATSSGDGPGFGVAVSLVALVAGAGIVIGRRGYPGQ